MSLKVGIIGLANVGKSTLFNGLIGQKKAEVSNYPFCTIEPNKGIVEIPDQKLDKIAKTLELGNVIRAPLEFVDIAGLIKGAHKGEGLGNEFLSHIQEVDLLCQVLPYYQDQNPDDHKKTVMTELLLKDLHQINIHLQSTDLSEEERNLLEKIKTRVNDGTPIKDQKIEKGERELLKRFNFLTNKKIFYIANIDENELSQKSDLKIPNEYIKISAKTEEDLIEIEKSEVLEYREALNIKESALDKIISKSYSLLNLISFYTLKQENSQIQAWPIRKGTTARKAAGVIHSDFEEKFIKAQIINWQDLVEAGSLKEAGTKGLVKIKGENYILKDGQVVDFKHSK